KELRLVVADAAERLRRISEADASQSRGDGKWVKKEILGHLIDSAVNNHQRFVRAQFANPFVWPGYDQDAWVVVNGYARRSWPDLIDLWISVNAHVGEVIATAPQDKLDTRCVIGEHEETLAWWM